MINKKSFRDKYFETFFIRFTCLVEYFENVQKYMLLMSNPKKRTCNEISKYS